jgi:hypothetical protein
MWSNAATTRFCIESQRIALPSKWIARPSIPWLCFPERLGRQNTIPTHRRISRHHVTVPTLPAMSQTATIHHMAGCSIEFHALAGSPRVENILFQLWVPTLLSSDNHGHGRSACHQSCPLRNTRQLLFIPCFSKTTSLQRVQSQASQPSRICD